MVQTSVVQSSACLLLAAACVTLVHPAVGDLSCMTPVLTLHMKHSIGGMSVDVFGNPVGASAFPESDALLSSASMLRLNGGSSKFADISAFVSATSASSPRKQRPKTQQKQQYPTMLNSPQTGTFNIFGGKFSVSKAAKGLASAFTGGISIFNGFTIDSANAQGLYKFPLMMADGSQKLPPRKDGRIRVLMLLSDTGGGHKASAKAIQAALDELYPHKFYCEITDIWTDYGKWPFSELVPGYQWAAKNSWPWRCTYYYGEFPPAKFMTERIADMRCYSNWRAYFESFAPDIVVSVHPLCQTLPLKILKDIGGGTRKVPFVTVVTDLGSASSTWFHKGVDRCCVPGDAIEKLALKHGLSKGQVRKHGLPVRQGFWKAASRKNEFKKVRAQLKLKNVPTVLVVGGGDGVGGLQKIAENVGDKMGKFAGECQLVVVCGKNEKVKGALQKRSWPQNVAVKVQGFVSNMDDYMVAADCLVTKAGPGTIAEASILGLPTMLSGFLPGQEAGNIPYVVDGGFGAFQKDAGKLATEVTKWLGDPAKLSDMSSKASKIGIIHSGATKDIARDIAEMVL